jgi:hypothetical protein
MSERGWCILNIYHKSRQINKSNNQTIVAKIQKQRKYSENNENPYIKDTTVRFRCAILANDATNLLAVKLSNPVISVRQFSMLLICII